MAAVRTPKHMVELTRTECLSLLAATSFGRVAVNGSRGPVIRPVNYMLDESLQSIVFRTAVGSKFQALINAANAAFEIDGTDPGGGTGWSVIVVGVTEEITRPADLRRLDGAGLTPWAPGIKSRWVGIRANSVSGRRIVTGADGASDHDD